MKSIQKGFSVVEISIVIAVIGFVGAIGLFVLDRQKNEISTETNTAQNNQEDDETAGWASVTSGQGAFSLKVPDGWNLQNWTSRDYLYASTYEDLAYDKGTAATVADGDTYAVDGGPVRHLSITGNPISESEGIGYYFDVRPEEFTTTSGAQGEKYEYTYPEDGEGVQNGDMVYLYRFEGEKTLVTVDYYVLNDEDDQVDLVEKSLKTLSFE